MSGCSETLLYLTHQVSGYHVTSQHQQCHHLYLYQTAPRNWWNTDYASDETVKKTYRKGITSHQQALYIIPAWHLPSKPAPGLKDTYWHLLILFGSSAIILLPQCFTLSHSSISPHPFSQTLFHTQGVPAPPSPLGFCETSAGSTWCFADDQKARLQPT